MVAKRLAHLSPYILATLAHEYLAIQASSATPERAFSVGGLVATKKRNRLSGERVGGIIFLHEGMKHKHLVEGSAAVF